MLKFDSEKPIYIQLSEWLTDMIVSGSIAEEEQIPSTTEISAEYKVNPATVLKGMNILVDKDIIYKKRGLGMFVAKGAVEKLKEERKKDFERVYVATMCSEAEKLGISKEDILKMIERGFGK